MQLKNLLLIISVLFLSISIKKKTRAALLKLEEQRRNHFSAGATLNYHSLPIRHHYRFLEKKYKCAWDVFRGKQELSRAKQSRYPTLDKIVNRLDHNTDKEIKMTTAIPFTKWRLDIPNEMTEKENKYSYVMVGPNNKTKTIKKIDILYVRNSNSDTGKGYFEVNESARERTKWTDVKANGKNDGDDLVDWDDLNGEDFHGDRDLDGNVSAKRTNDGNEHNQADDNDGNSTDGVIVGERKKNPTAELNTLGSWDEGDRRSQEQGDVLANTGKGIVKMNDTNNTEATKIETRSRSGQQDAEQTEKQLKTQNGILPSYSFNKLISKFKEGDERKKKPALTPYGAAHEHYERVLRMGDCHMPKQKIIKVHEVHPDPSKSYSPSCTILHQCGDDTGCCKDIKQECKAKNTTKVELYFFTTTLGKPQTVEKLYFDNHTECECQKRTDDMMPRDDSRISRRTKSTVERMQDENKKCTCPSKYATRLFRNGTCICDCFDKQDDCITLKKGKTHFSNQDKQCIERNDCLIPSCEFGTYIRRHGKCPNRREYYRLYNKYKTPSYRNLIT